MGVEKPDSNQKEHFKNRCIGFGTGNAKKEGEQAAAKMALINYGVLKEDQYTKADIYFPPWGLLEQYDGENPILTKNNDSYDEPKKTTKVKINNDDTNSVYSEKSIDL
jgi:hypothetical protein